LIGAPFHTLAPSYVEDDLAYMMGITQPVMMFCDQNNHQVVKRAAQMAKIDPTVIVMASEMEVLMPTGRESEFYPKYLGDSRTLLAAILCSSGTTGRSKAVCLTHSQLITTTQFFR
jgi:acyl-CoA synthetase (AMP-forming)/AMP-acid ligase II